MPEASEYFQRLLLSLHQGRCVSTDTAQRIRPLRAGWTLRVKPEGRRIEKDPLSVDLLDHWPLCQDVLEGLPAGQPPRLEFETSEFGQRVIFISDCGPDAVLGAQVAEEDGHDQSIGLVARHLHEAGSAQL